MILFRSLELRSQWQEIKGQEQRKVKVAVTAVNPLIFLILRTLLLDLTNQTQMCYNPLQIES